MFIKEFVKKQLEKVGYQIIKPNLRRDHLLRRMKLLNFNKINFILDVGASTGQYASIVRNAGFQGKIISFEPRSDAYGVLLKNTKKDNNWVAKNYGLGNIDEESIINI